MIDLAGRGLSVLGKLPHCGVVAIRNESLAIRVLDFLADEVAVRRAMLEEAGASSVPELTRRTGKALPHLMLLVGGADRLYATQGNDVVSPLTGPLHSLVAEANGLGIQLVFAGLPRIATQRLGEQVGRRLALRTPDAGDYVAVGCSRALFAELDNPRRAIDLQRGRVTQLCSVAGGAIDESEAVEAAIEALAAINVEVSRPAAKFLEVSWPLSEGRFKRLVIDATQQAPGIALGVSNATGSIIRLDPEDGLSWLISGGSKSGRSLTLAALAHAARTDGWLVVAGGFARSSHLRHSPDVHWVEMPNMGRELRFLDSSRTLLLIDDLHRWESRPVESILPEGKLQPLVVMAGNADVFSGVREPFECLGLMRPKHGVALAPDGSVQPFPVRRDAVREHILASRRPGHGLFFLHGEVMEITIPNISIPSKETSQQLEEAKWTHKG